MQLNFIRVCVAATMQLAASGVYAQTQSDELAGVNAHQLSGTNISGSSARTNPILTSAVDQTVPFKTESGVYLYPTVTAGMGHDDNLLRTSVNQIGASLYSLAPKLVAEIKDKGDRYTALASLNRTTYEGSASDSFTDSEILIAGDNYFSSRLSAAWSLGRVGGHDPRGTTERPISAEPDRWNSNNIQGRLIYGSNGAKGRLEFDLSAQDKTYDNNRANTLAADVFVRSYAMRGFYRLGTRSWALAEFRDAKNSYASALSTDGNQERRYYLGLSWNATAATTGSVKVGLLTKDFDVSGREGFRGGSWEAAVRWMPLTYSTFDVQANRTTADATGFGNYQLTTSTSVTWTHKWNPSLGSKASLGLLQTDFVGTSRSDSATHVALGVDYAIKRWLKAGIDWANTDNASLQAAAFRRNVTMLTLNVSL